MKEIVAKLRSNWNLGASHQAWYVGAGVFALAGLGGLCLGDFKTAAFGLFTAFGLVVISL